MEIYENIVDYIQPSQPTQQSLDAMFHRAHAFRIIEGGVSGDRPLGKKILAEGRNEKMLMGLRRFLANRRPESKVFLPR